MRKVKVLKVFLTILIISLATLPLIISNVSWPTMTRDYLFSNALEETGASNTVSSIYLGYRLMDTLGETLVLFVAITGTMSILLNLHKQALESVKTQSALAPEKRVKNALRTNLVEVVASKLGPIILLFGLYVMLFGHISPGGGFQGGVIFASAIVFLVLGTDVKTKITNSHVLERIEAFSFISLILVTTYVVFFPEGFFNNTASGNSFLSAGIIIVLNIIIGIKVGTSLAVMIIAMMGGQHDN
ncbi:MAG: MnhB domain-containing protein [Pleomorphochaeta sp.]